MVYITLKDANVIQLRKLLHVHDSTVTGITLDGKRVSYLDVIKIDYGIVDAAS